MKVKHNKRFIVQTIAILSLVSVALVKTNFVSQLLHSTSQGQTDLNCFSEGNSFGACSASQEEGMTNQTITNTTSSEEENVPVQEDIIQYDNESSDINEEGETEQDVVPRPHNDENQHAQNNPNNRPIYGVLTEPLRGTLHKNEEQISEIEQYIPVAHVKYLEQAGIKVVPVSYKLEETDLQELLNKLNGLYIPGDSHQAIQNDQYQHTFTTILTYVKERNGRVNNTFPLFLMGNSLHSLLFNKVRAKIAPLKSMKNLQNSNLPLRFVKNFNETYILDELSKQEEDEILNEGTFFNKQKLGMTMNDFKKATSMYRQFQVVATFKTNNDKDSEFIAIMEGKKLPIYVFTYNIEMTQFVFTDAIMTNYDPLDHSIPARAHSQYIANQISEEGKLSSTAFQNSKESFQYLIRHHELASIEYSSVMGQSNMPLGLEKHDVYFIK